MKKEEKLQEHKKVWKKPEVNQLEVRNTLGADGVTFDNAGDLQASDASGE